MPSTYTHNRKVRLRNKIQKLSKKEDCVKVVELIKTDPVFKLDGVSQNSNGIFMYFHELDDETYNCLNTLMKNIKKRDDEITKRNTIDLEETTPYAEEEFPSMKGVSAKIKYSNREKNLIKRKDYDRKLNEDTDGEIVYMTDITTVTSSEKELTEVIAQKT